MKGKFITFEGIDVSGKTSNIRNIVSYYEHTDTKMHSVSEYLDVPFCNSLRTTLNNQDIQLTPCAEALAFYSSRIEHTNRCIRPFLNSGVTVLADRYHHSTRAYQGLRYDNVDLLHALVKEHLEEPDLVIFLDISVETYVDRLKRRGYPADSIESRGAEYFQEVRKRFLSYAGDNFVIVDANRPLDVVLDSTLKLVSEFLKT